MSDPFWRPEGWQFIGRLPQRAPSQRAATPLTPQKSLTEMLASGTLKRARLVRGGSEANGRWWPGFAKVQCGRCGALVAELQPSHRAFLMLRPNEETIEQYWGRVARVAPWLLDQQPREADYIHQVRLLPGFKADEDGVCEFSAHAAAKWKVAKRLGVSWVEFTATKRRRSRGRGWEAKSTILLGAPFQFRCPLCEAPNYADVPTLCPPDDCHWCGRCSPAACRVFFQDHNLNEEI